MDFPPSALADRADQHRLPGIGDRAQGFAPAVGTAFENHRFGRCRLPGKQGDQHAAEDYFPGITHHRIPSIVGYRFTIPDSAWRSNYRS
jgi:hypothetical protein